MPALPTSVAAGALVGLLLAAGTHVLLRRALARRGTPSLGPADRVTLVRAWLTCAVAALAVVALGGGEVTIPLVALATSALLLDLVDGEVARRTGTMSGLGARFDMEVDALLILVLAVHVGARAGWAVVGLGLARYAVLAGSVVVPWLGGGLPPRRWRKLVAALQGVALVVAASGLLPGTWSTGVLAAAGAGLALSFGTELVERWRTRPLPSAAPSPSGMGAHRRWVGTAVAGVLVWLALAGPDRVAGLSPRAVLVLPLDGLVLLALVALGAGRVPRWALRVAGTGLGVTLVLRLLDLGFDWSLARPFDPVTQASYVGPAAHLLSDSTGPVVAVLVGVALVGLVVAVVVALPWAVSRLAGVAGRHRTRTGRVVAFLLAAWLGCTLTGVERGPHAPVATTGAVGLVARHVEQSRTGLAERAAFARGLAHDPLSRVPAEQLLRGLQGKDVLVVFVESYGRTALEGDPDATAPVAAALADADARLQQLGWSSRSAWLTSPTFGGISWLAHSTLQTGLWVDGQGRYDELLASHRESLSATFRRAGWRTVADIPSNYQDWPEGLAFYRWDRLYDSRDVGYAGPRLGYARVPDQFTLKAFAERELGSGHRPVMAELDLDSSHVPWAPLPRLLDWRAMGDGTVYGTAAGRQAGSKDAVWTSRSGVRTAYGQSVAYSLGSIVSFVEARHDDDLVVVVVGDHQPSAVVSGRDSGHDVPVTVLARDPRVVGRAAGWGWTAGMRPASSAPVWRMDTFRDRFLSTYAAPGRGDPVP